MNMRNAPSTPLYRGENRGTERLSDLSKATQLETVAVRLNSRLSSYRAETYGQGGFGQTEMGGGRGHGRWRDLCD